MNNSTKLVSPFRLCSLLQQEKDPTLALQLFKSPNPERKKLFRYTLRCYDLIISKLGRAKMFDEMQQILTQLSHETRFVSTEIIFCNVITYYGRAKMPLIAIETFHRIPCYRCPHTIKSFNSLLNVLFKCREFDRIRELIKGIDKYGQPDVCTFNILIHCCLVMGCFDDAFNLFDEMCHRGLKPDCVTFGTLVFGYCSSSRFEDAFKLKEDMLQVYGVKPDAYVYASLIKGLCKAGNLSSAMKLKEEMMKNEFQLDSAIYSTLLDDMARRGCTPDIVSYRIILDGLCDNMQFNEAIFVLDEMIFKGYMPHDTSVGKMLDGLFKLGNMDLEFKILNSLIKGCCTNANIWRLLVSKAVKLLKASLESNTVLTDL
ncbi:hypothetical protein ACFE04_007258 [Oxalis oulophora]